MVDPALPQEVVIVAPALHTTLPPALPTQAFQEHQALALYSQDLEPPALRTVGLREDKPLPTPVWEDLAIP